MNYNAYNNSSQNGRYQSCPPGTRGQQRALPNSSMSATLMNPGNNGNAGLASMSSPRPMGHTYGGYPQQMSCPQGRQQVGRRSVQRPANSMQGQQNQQNMRVLQQQQKQVSQGQTPSPININVSQAMLAAANNTPNYSDRAEPTVDGNSNVKYIPLSWDAILGKTGMNGMRVSMAPPTGGDPNANRQLKVSFGGQGGQVMAGETPLRVMSFQPVSTGRMDLTSGGQESQNNSGQMNAAGAQNQYMSQGQGQQAARGSCSCPNCRR